VKYRSNGGRRKHIAKREQLEGLHKAYNVLPGLSYLVEYAWELAWA
jgi:hypothetical protein